MLIEKEIVKSFAELFLSLSKEAAIQAHKYLETHDKISGYCKYPIKHEIFPKDDPRSVEYFEKIPFLAFDIPKYYIEDFPKELIQYGAIFSGYGKDCLDCTKLQEFEPLVRYIMDKSELKKLIVEKEDESSLKLRIKTMTHEIVERYLYSINATSDIPDDLEEKIKPFVSEKLLRYLSDELHIDIYVPICLATFEDDIIKLSEQIEIVRISDDIQKSRQKACSYEMNNEDWVAACATHMIVLHNYHFKNTELFSINSATQDYNAYPLHMIDIIMAAIRIITGYTIGYEQILTYPIDWIDGFCADLIPLYGSKGHFVNPKEIEKFWMHLSISKVNCEQAEHIQTLYSSIIECDKDAKKGNLLFALKRFNRCMLRNENDDMAIDATIGLEALLSGGTKGEITYTISNRMPIVFSHENSDIYLPTNCRSIMKKIYNYRSKIVHGGGIKDKDKYYELNGRKIEVEKIAVDFLRYSLLFILHNQEFIDAKKFDEYIDSVIPKNDIL
ncbi:hypothetical protein ACXAUS_000672 [Clostridium sporogenes]|uniref:hypothetical protein n=1 Tax=Clostridium sporogenes TaxID=1509 RepID=UPI0029028838|nr:HEPN domain-containing protein [Clostridium botulinum]